MTQLKGHVSFDLKITQGDISIGSDGDLKKVEGNEKLIQDSLKIVLTPLGVNIFFPGYGSLLTKGTIGSVLPDEFTNTIASDQIKNSLQTLQKLQKLQEQSGQKVTASELLAAVKNVRIEKNQIDSRVTRIYLELLTKALTIKETSFTVEL